MDIEENGVIAFVICGLLMVISLQICSWWCQWALQDPNPDLTHHHNMILKINRKINPEGSKNKELPRTIQETDERKKQQERLDEPRKALFHDFKTLETNPIDGVFVATSETAILTWNVVILSAEGSVELLVSFFFSNFVIKSLVAYIL